MSGKLLGLLGGMSWESTAHYYAQINRRVRDARGGLHSAPLLLHSIDFAPLAELQRQDDWAQAAALLGEAGRGLAQAGAGALLICSNTMHKVAAPVAERAGIPLLHIADAHSDVDPATGLAGKALSIRPPLRFEGAEHTAIGDNTLLRFSENAEPIRAALRQGADVIIGGRSSDAAVFAAPALFHGFAEDRAYYLGKVLECASFCAEPYGGKETVMGTISHEDVQVTAMHPDQRCTIASVSGHAMYERSNPYEEFFAGGRLDMTHCHYEQIDPRTTRITGSRFEPAQKVRVKLEGAGKVGERYVGLCGIRDPYTVANVDRVIAWAREQVRLRFGDSGYELHYNVYGRDGVMGALEPLRDQPGHELCVMVQGVAPTKEMAEELTMIGLRQMFYARLPDVKGTAGSVAFPLDEVLHASPAYRWTLNHTVEVDDPMELFKTHLTDAGI